jgi:hypothetical protein
LRCATRLTFLRESECCHAAGPPGGKGGTATCAERHLCRATGQKAFTPEIRRYRELETGFFAKFVQQ